MCDLCGKSCINRHQYLWHIREYHQEKRFSCGQCDKKFAQKAGLNKHVKVMHERSSSVTCDICGNVSSLKREFLQPERIFKVKEEKEREGEETAKVEKKSERE